LVDSFECVKMHGPTNPKGHIVLYFYLHAALSLTFMSCVLLKLYTKSVDI